MSEDSIQGKSNKTRPDGRSTKPRPGGLLHSDVVNYVDNPVLRNDRYIEPIQANGIIKLIGDYVRFFDESDSLLHAILSVYNSSPTTRSIIRQKATLTMGDGFMAMQGRANSLFPTLSKQNTVVTDAKVVAALEDILLDINAEGQGLDTVFMETAMEHLTFGNSYVGMGRNKELGLLTCYSMPFVKGRLKKKEEDGDKEGELTIVGFNEDWSVKSWSNDNVTEIPLYPEWSEPDDGGVERTVIHMKDHAPGFEYYGLPEWISAMECAANEYRIAKHNGRKLVNRNRPNGILQLFGETSVDEARKLVADVKKKLSTLGSNDGLLVQVLRDEKLTAKFTPIEDNAEGSYLELSRTSAQGIVTAHRWTMSLAGLATKGQLGTNEQIRREFEIAYSTVIRPFQNMLLRRFVNVFIKELGDLKKEFKGIFLDIANSMPVSFVGDIDINSVLTDDEKRQIAGYEPAVKTANQPTPDNGSNTNTDPNPAK